MLFKEKFLMDPKLMTPEMRHLERFSITAATSARLEKKFGIGVKVASRAFPDCTGVVIPAGTNFYIKYSRYTKKGEVWHYYKLETLLREMCEGPYATKQSIKDAEEIYSELCELFTTIDELYGYDEKEDKESMQAV